jgi:sporulation protein YlmC with PRC-barrel domain
MRLTHLLGSEVVTLEGRQLGQVHDVHLVQDGPPLGTFGAALRLDAMLVGPGSLGARLGYSHGHVHAPLLIAATLHRTRRDAIQVPWSAVRAVREGSLVVQAPRDFRSATPAGRQVDAAYELLDRQMIDIDGMHAGKVDDLGFRWPEAGGAPYVDAILSGPGALARRVGGRPGRAWASLHRRLSDREDGETATVSFGVVTRISSDIGLAVGREDLDVMAFEAWVRDHVISKIPGA